MSEEVACQERKYEFLRMKKDSDNQTEEKEYKKRP